MVDPLDELVGSAPPLVNVDALINKAQSPSNLNSLIDSAPPTSQIRVEDGKLVPLPTTSAVRERAGENILGKFGRKALESLHILRTPTVGLGGLLRFAKTGSIQQAAESIKSGAGLGEEIVGEEFARKHPLRTAGLELVTDPTTFIPFGIGKKILGGGLRRVGKAIAPSERSALTKLTAKSAETGKPITEQQILNTMEEALSEVGELIPGVGRPTPLAIVQRQLVKSVEGEALDPQTIQALDKIGVSEGELKGYAVLDAFDDVLPREFDNLPVWAKKIVGDLSRVARKNVEIAGFTPREMSTFSEESLRHLRVLEGSPGLDDIIRPVEGAEVKAEAHIKFARERFIDDRLRGMGFDDTYLKGQTAADKEKLFLSPMREEARTELKRARIMGKPKPRAVGETPLEKARAVPKGKVLGVAGKPAEAEDLYKLFDIGEEPISKTAFPKLVAKEAAFGFRVPSVLFPEISVPVIRAFERRGNALMNYGAMLERWKDLVPEVKDRRMIGFLLDNVPADDLISKSVDEALAGTGLAGLLNPIQKSVLREVAASYRTLGLAGGLKAEQYQKAYLTRIMDVTKKAKQIDAKEVGRVLQEDIPVEDVFGRFNIPKTLFNRFFQKRKGGKIYNLDFAEAFEAYMYPTTRKAYLEPALKEIIPHYKNLRETNPDLAKEVFDYINDVYARVPNPTFNMDRASRGLVGLAYKGTLWGNVSAGLTNMTQWISNTIPEIGVQWTGVGLKQLLTTEGRTLFSRSGIIYSPVELGAATVRKAGRVSRMLGLGKITPRLDKWGDFMTQAEYVNRGITWLGARSKQISLGKGVAEAEELARDMVRKTQFSITGADLPRTLRKHRVLTQFMSFPIKQTELVGSWVKNKEWGKLAKFTMISYMIGGPRAFDLIPGASYQDLKKKLPDNWREAVKGFEESSSVAGFTGVDLSQKFGMGMFPNLKDYYMFGGPPVTSSGIKLLRFGADIVSGDIVPPGTSVEGAKQFAGEAAKPLSRIMAPFIRGGVQGKKIFESVKEIQRGGQFDSRGRLIRKTTWKESIKKIFAQPVERVKEREEVHGTAVSKQEVRREKQRIIDLLVGSAKMDNKEKASELRSRALNRLKEWNTDKDKPKIDLDIDDLIRELKLKGISRRDRQLKALSGTMKIFEAGKRNE